MSKKAQQRREARLRQQTGARLQQLTRALRLEQTTTTEEAMALAEAQAVLGILSEGRTAAKAIEVGHNATTFFTGTTTRIRTLQPFPIACHAGCAWCCSLPVSITAPEALVIAEYLRRTLTPETLGEVTTRLAAQAQQIAALSTDAHAEANIPCALLQGGLCRVYEARPLRCRGWSSRDASACKTAVANPFCITVESDTVLFTFGCAVQEGLTIGLRGARVDANVYELHSAVHRALETPNAAARWARGESVFHGCTPSERGCTHK